MSERTISANIRRIRLDAGMTLTALAKRADMSKGALSKIETGRISSPIGTLMRLAEAIGVPIADFFAEPDAAPDYVLTRKGQGRKIAQEGSRLGYVYEALALERRDKAAEPFVLTVRPEDGVGEFRHPGEEFVHLLSGRLRFTVGDDVMTLRPGDSLYFDSSRKHTTKALGTRPARFICVFMQTRAPGRARKA
ncbi:MAG TPA: XRE family transcriptional regulator [Planctomycetota bacterium]|nr:XRE family transcriptional regulator [Planctomycetota bacterium]